MAIRLELFDAPEPAEADDGPSAEFTAGYSEGLQAGLAQAAETQGKLSEELVANLSELGFGYAEARHHILDALAPLFELIAQRIVPMALSESLGPEIARIIGSAASASANAPVQIYATPETISLLEPIFEHRLGVPWQLRADPDLAIGQVRWASDGAEMLFDQGPILASIQDALATILDESERKAAHG